MTFIPLSETELVSVTSSEAVKLHREVILKEITKRTAEYEFRLWQELGNAKNVDQLKKVIKSRQTTLFQFDPDEYDRDISIKISDNVIVIEELRNVTERGILRNIKFFDKLLQEFVYYKGINNVFDPANHFISIKFYEAIRDFVENEVKTYEVNITRQLVEESVDVLKRERHSTFKAIVIGIAGETIWEKGLSRFQIELSEKLKINKESSLIEALKLKLLWGNRFTYMVQNVGDYIGGKLVAIKGAELGNDARYYDNVTIKKNPIDGIQLSYQGKDFRYTNNYFLFTKEVVTELEIEAYKVSRKARKLLIQGLLAKLQ